MMKHAAVTLLLSVVVAGAGVADPPKKDAAPAAGQQSAFEAFKQLAGEWAGQGSAGTGPGQGARVSFKVTANGSAVVETEMPGTGHEMITVIRPDGNELALTHYCALGNQPEMRAPANFDGKTVAFKFVRAGNLKSDQDSHMRTVTYTFVDRDTLKAEWTLYQAGKPSGKATFEMKRMK